MSCAITLRRGHRLLGLAVLVAFESISFGQIDFDGNVDFGAGGQWENATKVLQNNYTGFGDQGFTPGGFPGSELDELFLQTDGTFLYLGVTGNLEQNGNAIIILLDTGNGGQGPGLETQLAPDSAAAQQGQQQQCLFNGPPNAVQGLGRELLRDPGTDPDSNEDDVTSISTDPPTILDGGGTFSPDYAYAADTAGGTLSISKYELFDSEQGTIDDPTTGPPNCAPAANPASNESLAYQAVRTFVGRTAVNSGDSLLTGGTNPGGSTSGVRAAFDNTGKLGVKGAGDELGDPRTQTSGLELRIPLAEIGLDPLPAPGDLDIRITVLLTSSDGFVSSQTLPGLGRGSDISDLGFRPDFTTVATGGIGGDGNQFAHVQRAAASFGNPWPSIDTDLDGLNVVSDFGAAPADDGPNLVASQDTQTSFGDRDCFELIEGSELDALYVKLGEYDSVNDNQFLYIGVTGNLQSNSNAITMLLDVPGNGVTGSDTAKSEIAPETSVPDCPGSGPPVYFQMLGVALETDDNGTPGDPTDDVTFRSADTTTTIFDTGFAPDFAVGVNNTAGTIFGHVYKHSQAELGTWDDPGTGLPDCAENTQFPASNEALAYFAESTTLGSIGVNTASSGPPPDSSSPNGSEFAFNNTGTAGVSDTDVSDPLSQTTGLEFKISLKDLGFTALSPSGLSDLNGLGISVLLTGDTGFVSSQTLPGLNEGVVADPTTLNLGNRPDFRTDPRATDEDQFVTIASLAPTAAFDPPIDGENIDTDFASGLIVTQDTVTGFGDSFLQEVLNCDEEFLNRSELDQLLVLNGVGRDTGEPTLDIALTGNLQRNGNQIVIFLDTQSGGEGGALALADNPDRMAGLDGDQLPNSAVSPNGLMEADFAVLINMWPGGGPLMYVDWFDLPGNTKVFVGQDEVSGGDGFLTNGDSPLFSVDWSVIVDNGNIEGVTDIPEDDPQDDPDTGNAVTATRGFELSIPLVAIGSPENGADICVFAVLTGDGGFYSNQLVPPLPGSGGVGNLGDGPHNLATLGYQCLTFTVGPSSLCNDPRYDHDADGDVDGEDFAVLQSCLDDGSGVIPGCECFDFDIGTGQGDGRVDDLDVALFEICASGPGVPANATCDDPLP